ncbi:MAG TPA: ATP synthase F1 subunit gamma [Firmicutes bacterium]|nr:ATP synthase F1 subunit gamma [Bacillota bacterium]
MAQSSREIKRRIASISSTQQITSAMEMIAAAKLRRAQEQVLNARPYFERMWDSLGLILHTLQAEGVELSGAGLETEGGADGHCLLVFTSDRGLAGGYNAAIIRRAEAFLQENPATQMVIVGRKARDHFRRRRQTFLAEFANLGDDPTWRRGEEIARMILDFYEHGLFNRVTILYTKFINTVTHRVTLRTVLPVPTEQGYKQEVGDGLNSLYLFEPSPQAALQSLIPLYVRAAIYESLVEAKASELGARMAAMRNATDNAGELIRELNITYNRARQAQITREIAEIVGGADALES